ncbi:MAG: effector-associated domain EAD1-containing protein [Cyanobacteria bacterium P01_F01_bin.53]
MATGNIAGHNRGRSLMGQPLRALCEALEDAIGEEVLPQVVAYALEEKLRNIPKASTYDCQIFNLVEWADSNNKVRDLIIGAALENPGNELLQQFVGTHFQLLVELEAHVLSDNGLLPDLLKSITPIIDFLEIVLPACRQTLPDLDISAPELRSQLSNPELGASLKWLILLDLFLKVWKENDEGLLYIVLFVQNFACLVTGKTKAALDGWIGHLPDALRPSATASMLDLYPERPSSEALKILPAHFVVSVEPFETSDNYGVKGYVVTRLGNEDRYAKCESITLESPSGQDVPGTLPGPSGDVLENIRGVFPDWLGKALEVILNQALTIQKNYGLEFPPTPHLTVEFWLPFEQLSAAAETWKIYGKPTRLKRLNRGLGQEHRVLVRSYDRFNDPDSLIKLSKTWQEILPLSQNDAFATAAVEKQYCLDCLGPWQALEKQVKQSLMGVFLAFPICCEEYELARENLFAWILENGVPSVLWSRSAGLSDADKAALEKEMQSWLVAANLTQLDQFFEAVYKARKKSAGDSLALWCDEPKRMIELKQFREGGRLRA